MKGTWSGEKRAWRISAAFLYSASRRKAGRIRPSVPCCDGAGRIRGSKAAAMGCHSRLGLQGSHGAARTTKGRDDFGRI